MGSDRLLSALFEPRRRAILVRLAAEPLPVGDLARGFDVSRPAISQHIAVLRDAGLVEHRPGAGRNRYAIRPEGIASARAALAELAGELPGAEEPFPADPGTGSAPPDVAMSVHSTATPERLFALATTVEGLAVWLGPVTADARVGGPFRLDLGGDAAAGTYTVVEPPSRVVFGWGQEGGTPGPDSSRVELRFTQVDGGTHVTLEHRGLPMHAQAPHLGSWATHLPRLVAAAESAS